jgi:hypothetical protein
VYIQQARHYATNWKVAGSIPDGVIGILHWHNPSSRTMATGSTHRLREMSTRNISWGVKAAGAWDWQPYHLHVPTVYKSGCRILLEPCGPVEACSGTAANAIGMFLKCNVIWLVDAKRYLWPLVPPDDGDLTTETCRGNIKRNINSACICWSVLTVLGTSSEQVQTLDRTGDSGSTPGQDALVLVAPTPCRCFP